MLYALSLLLYQRATYGMIQTFSPVPRNTLDNTPCDFRADFAPNKGGAQNENGGVEMIPSKSFHRRIRLPDTCYMRLPRWRENRLGNWSEGCVILACCHIQRHRYRRPRALLLRYDMCTCTYMWYLVPGGSFMITLSWKELVLLV